MKKKDELEKSIELERERDEYLAGWKRARADFENYKKEENSRRRELSLRSREEVLIRLLPVLDSLERALQSARNSRGDILKGLSQIQSQLKEALSACGIQEIVPADGEEFDPSLHEAIGEIKVSGVPPGMIAQVAEKGYMFSGNVLRPARVLIASGKE
ncbi:MAG: nucleotide exchange factor GrpE [bacterium]|nr:nucleotide exchange factor GrpE [bacterium]